MPADAMLFIADITVALDDTIPVAKEFPKLAPLDWNSPILLRNAEAADSTIDDTACEIFPDAEMSEFTKSFIPCVPAEANAVFREDKLLYSPEKSAPLISLTKIIRFSPKDFKESP